MMPKKVVVKPDGTPDSIGIRITKKLCHKCTYIQYANMNSIDYGILFFMFENYYIDEKKVISSTTFLNKMELSTMHYPYIRCSFAKLLGMDFLGMKVINNGNGYGYYITVEGQKFIESLLKNEV